MQIRALIVASFISLLLHSQARANFLTNPGFEDGLNNWDATGNAAIRTGDPPPHEGIRYVFGNATPQHTIWQDILEGIRMVGSNNDAYLDAAYLNVVPEPNTCGLLFVGLLTAVAHRVPRRLVSTNTHWTPRTQNVL